MKRQRHCALANWLIKKAILKFFTFFLLYSLPFSSNVVADGSSSVVVRQRAGINQFVAFDADGDIKTPHNDTLDSFLSELNDPKFDVLRLSIWDTELNSAQVRSDIHQALLAARSKNKVVVISFSIFPLYDATLAWEQKRALFIQYALTLRDLIPDGAKVIVDLFNEIDVQDSFKPWTGCTPSPLYWGDNPQAVLEYQNRMKELAVNARQIFVTESGKNIKLTANGVLSRTLVSWYGSCTAFGTQDETWSQVKQRIERYFTPIAPSLDFLSFNFYPIDAQNAGKIGEMMNFLNQKFPGKSPFLMLETGFSTGDQPNESLRQLIFQTLFEAYRNQPLLAAVLVYYGREKNGYGIKELDGTPKPAYAVVPLARDFLTPAPPLWAKHPYLESGRLICDWSYELNPPSQSFFPPTPDKIFNRIKNPETQTLEEVNYQDIIEWTNQGLILKKTQNTLNAQESVSYNPPLLLVKPQLEVHDSAVTYSHFTSNYMDKGKLVQKSGIVVAVSTVLGWENLQLTSGTQKEAVHWMSELHFFEKGKKGKKGAYMGSLREELWVAKQAGQSQLLKTKGKVFSGSNFEFVEGLYLDILNRNGEPDGGLDYWVPHLDHGYSRLEMVLDFWLSTEHVAQYALDRMDNMAFTRHLYKYLLHVDPTQSDVDYWTDALNQGLSRRNAARYFVDSETYRLMNPSITEMGKDVSLIPRLTMKPEAWEMELAS